MCRFTCRCRTYDCFCVVQNIVKQRFRSCNSLRCTSCDFNVVSYKNYAWTEATDYLFLRNNYPDDDKLMTNLYKNYNRNVSILNFIIHISIILVDPTVVNAVQLPLIRAQR